MCGCRPDLASILLRPPYFHPEQASAAIDAGKHVYVAKPVAVDVPGCLSISESAKKASSRELCFLADFQTRSDPFCLEALRRVHDEKALGGFVFGEAMYHLNYAPHRLVGGHRHVTAPAPRG